MALQQRERSTYSANLVSMIDHLFKYDTFFFITVRTKSSGKVGLGRRLRFGLHPGTNQHFYTRILTSSLISSQLACDNSTEEWGKGEHA